MDENERIARLRELMMEANNDERKVAVLRFVDPQNEVEIGYLQSSWGLDKKRLPCLDHAAHLRKHSISEKTLRPLPQIVLHMFSALVVHGYTSIHPLTRNAYAETAARRKMHYIERVGLRNITPVMRNMQHLWRQSEHRVGRDYVSQAHLNRAVDDMLSPDGGKAAFGASSGCIRAINMISSQFSGDIVRQELNRQRACLDQTILRYILDTTLIPGASSAENQKEASISMNRFLSCLAQDEEVVFGSGATRIDPSLIADVIVASGREPIRDMGGDDVP